MALLKLAKLDGKPEIFHTLQGEGVSVGVASVFVRSSLCNLHCTWCDTDYTWNWTGTPWQHESGQKFSKDDYIISLEAIQVAEIVASYDCKNIILTGGEPLLQQLAWEEMIQYLRELDPHYRFEVETNGTQVPSEFMSSAINQWNVSPKLNNSGNKEEIRINRSALQNFVARENAWFKFVIQSEEDLTEVQSLEKTYHLPKDKILLMPEGRTEQALKQKRLWLADICRDQNYRFSDRLHIQLWGSKRGV